MPTHALLHSYANCEYELAMFFDDKNVQKLQEIA